MSDALAPSPWLTPRFPLDDAALPSGPRFAILDAPPADRFVFRGGEAARMACTKAFGAELPARLGAAGRSGERAALWLGPDEWLLIAEGGSVDTLAAALEAGLAGAPHSLVDVSHRAGRADRLGRRRRARAQRRLPARSAAEELSRRHGDAHPVRQGRDRPVAARRGPNSASRSPARFPPGSPPRWRRRRAGRRIPSPRDPRIKPEEGEGWLRGCADDRDLRRTGAR